MATLAFSIAGQFAGGLIGGPIGATVGRALGALAGSVVDNALFGEPDSPSVGRQSDVRLQGSSQGGAIPRIYGWNRVSGNIIWATELERIIGQSSGAKSTSSNETSEETISANFAVAFCEGEVAHIGRIWADGELLDSEGLNIRFYRGTETQLADSLIVAKQGADRAPAYRGTCYLVFERLPLEPYGNRIPNISVELCRSVGDLEQSIKAITVIPGATEFGYDPTPRVRIVGPGRVVAENTHVLSRSSDWTLSIDELQDLCPNLEHVALVIAWFGDDLRCGDCTIQPRVENASRTIKNTEWSVDGLTRAGAVVVSQHEGDPAYGGTPSDASVVAAIADLKARGIKVTLYPIILMDVPAGNALTDPYTQTAGQPAYPWRGRITCDPAPDVVATPDQTAGVDSQVNAFVNGTWGYRRMFLHYANLAQSAGGVDAILIGSEMRQMSILRRSATEFPFVSALAALAAGIRAIVGSGTKITYAADWSEYSGYQPADAPGDKYFHLDPLWASADIDAVGIDNYMPLSDWREGGDHADAALAASPRDLGYLQNYIAGGEGFDWYYASDADRISGTRTTITDGAHSEPWVFRYKDLESWWRNPHHNRISGVRDVSPTAWVPEGKPFWLTELGCGAVDKGSNLPSAFADAKSSEDTLPHFSTGTPDPLQQRQHLRAHHLWWQPDAPDFAESNNPSSSVYAGRMLDPDRIYVWTWDARPYPAFPNLDSVWSDGVNHATGHWLTGRFGALGANEMIAAIAQDFDVQIEAEVSGDVHIQGLQVGNITTLRNAIAPVAEAADIFIRDQPEGLVATRVGTVAVANIGLQEPVDNDGDILTRTQPDPVAITGQLGLSYFDRQQAYAIGTVTAVALEGANIANANSGLVINSANARAAAENALVRLNISNDTIELGLPPSLIGLEAGDIISVEGQQDGPFVINEIRDGTYRRVTARAISERLAFAVSEQNANQVSSVAPATGDALVIGAHLPPDPSGTGPSQLVIGAFAEPWPGEVVITSAATGSVLARLPEAATMGMLTGPVSEVPSELWDRQTEINLELYSGHLSSASRESVLAGSNRITLERDDGTWEIIGFTDAELVSASTYLVTGLLRGLNGTGDVGGAISGGTRMMVLDQRVTALDVDAENLGGTISVIAFTGSQDSEGNPHETAIGLDPVVPLAPAGLMAQRAAGSSDVTIDWTRRSRVNGNSWALSEVPLEPAPQGYRLQIFDGVMLVRESDLASSSFTYLAADQITDFGGLPASFDFKIAQVSPTLGAGHQASGEFNG